MKRKLDENDEPSQTQLSEIAEPAESATETSFADLGLDTRLLQAVAEQKYHAPTLVQRRAIPAALNGQDVLAKAKTGSGKTAAYVLPVLHAILKRKAVSGQINLGVRRVNNSRPPSLTIQTDSTACTSALILVPTRELANQVHKAVEALSAYCAKDVSAIKLSDKVSAAVQRSLLSNSPDVVVATPARAWTNIESGALSLDRLTHLVLDEADLVLSYGYSDDLQSVARALPKGVQTILMSATLTGDVDELKGILCRNPTLLDLEEKEADSGGVEQYYVKWVKVHVQGSSGRTTY